MGYWGYGNFEGDLPRDFLADMVYVWERIIDHMLAGEATEADAVLKYLDAQGVRLPRGK